LTNIPDGLANLVDDLLPWAASMSSVTFYIYGSRVRGDHRADSDVDIHFDTDDATTDDRLTLFAQDTDDFYEVPQRWQSKIMGDATKRWPELRTAVRNGRVVLRKENIVCVWLPPKPSTP
jgi:predicted nucleotidyltransferase